MKERFDEVLNVHHHYSIILLMGEIYLNFPEYLLLNSPMNPDCLRFKFIIVNFTNCLLQINLQ